MTIAKRLMVLVMMLKVSTLGDTTILTDDEERKKCVILNHNKRK